MLNPENEVELELEDSTPVYFNKIDLMTAIRHDCVAALSFYLQEELTLEVPDFHEWIWNELMEALDAQNYKAVRVSLRKLFAVPREHAKSTLAKVACILLMKYTPFGFLLYVSKTNGHAKNAIRDIIYWLDSPQESMLYGKVVDVKSSETDSLWIREIWYPDADFVMRKKRVILKALGADQQVRGLLIMNRRPEIIIIDDIEDNDNTTKDQQPKLDEWFMGPLFKSFARRHFVLMIGNMIRDTTLLARLSKMPVWRPTVYGSIVRDSITGELRPLWQGRWTMEALLAEYREYVSVGTGHIWEAEMMNLTQNEILGRNLVNIPLCHDPDPDEVEAGFIMLDPAFGEKSHNDDSAITVHVRLKGTLKPRIVDKWVGKTDENGLLSQLLEMSYKWGLTTWVIESVAAQKLFIPLFKLLLKDQGINPDVFVILPVQGGNKTKASRIQAFTSTFMAQSYLISESNSEIVTELQLYNPATTKHDDLIDSAAYGPIVWQHFPEIIKSQGVQQVAFAAFNTPESMIHRDALTVCNY